MSFTYDLTKTVAGVDYSVTKCDGVVAPSPFLKKKERAFTLHVLPLEWLEDDFFFLERSLRRALSLYIWIFLNQFCTWYTINILLFDNASFLFFTVVRMLL